MEKDDEVVPRQKMFGGSGAARSRAEVVEKADRVFFQGNRGSAGSDESDAGVTIRRRRRRRVWRGGGGKFVRCKKVFQASALSFHIHRRRRKLTVEETIQVCGVGGHV